MAIVCCLLHRFHVPTMWLPTDEHVSLSGEVNEIDKLIESIQRTINQKVAKAKTVLFVCLFYCFTAHAKSACLQQYTTPTVYVSSELPLV